MRKKMSCVGTLSRQLSLGSLFILMLLLDSYLLGAQVITTGTNTGTVSGTGLNLPGASTPTGQFGGQQTFIALTARGGLRLPTFETVKGSPFLHPEYHSAFVQVKSGYSSNGVMVKFNIYGNEIIFSQNGNELALDSVEYVSYTTVGKNGNVEVFNFKTGFPPIGTNTRQTIYQVLDSGSKAVLLKYYYQKVGEVKSMGTAPEKEFVTYQEFYISTPKGGIRKIKLDIQSLKEAMPEEAAEIERIVNEKKLKLKKESDLVLLINELNKPKAF